MNIPASQHFTRTAPPLVRTVRIVAAVQENGLRGQALALSRQASLTAGGPGGIADDRLDHVEFMKCSLKFERLRNVPGVRAGRFEAT
jgi:hypothetical protein